MSSSTRNDCQENEALDTLSRLVRFKGFYNFDSAQWRRIEQEIDYTLYEYFRSEIYAYGRLSRPPLDYCEMIQTKFRISGSLNERVSTINRLYGPRNAIANAFSVITGYSILLCDDDGRLCKPDDLLRDGSGLESLRVFAKLRNDSPFVPLKAKVHYALRILQRLINLSPVSCMSESRATPNFQQQVAVFEEKVLRVTGILSREEASGNPTELYTSK